MEGIRQVGRLRRFARAGKQPDFPERVVQQLAQRLALGIGDFHSDEATVSGSLFG
jgi:hypothetical protein